MKLLMIAVLVFASAVGIAQEKSTAVVPPAAAQQEIAELQRQAKEAALAAELANARLETAQQRVVTAVIKAMAESGCSTSRCSIGQDKEGHIYFERKSTEPDAPKIPEGSRNKPKQEN